MLSYGYISIPINIKRFSLVFQCKHDSDDLFIAFLQCFDTVGWVIRPVKTVGRITYIVLVQTLNPAQSINQNLSIER